ncbi:hypothetical protein [Methyloradius palustris]|uniref:Periplasmic protein n=1 Tax=Methyloradius palustris TaxID=2778876 RepID=A0A8D5FZM4_9PROT|nr:hypothetical protein [Methyloradius palustris]BCM25204.1 hypothetical protein ZMTM_14630 [Methyloradius palustris]
MHKFLINSLFGIMLALGSSIFSLSWAAIVTPDDSMMPCDKVKIDNKPCSTDSDGVKRPEPVPTEKDTIVIPPEIPAEKLPDRKNISPGLDTRESGIKSLRY